MGRDTKINRNEMMFLVRILYVGSRYDYFGINSKIILTYGI